MIVLEIILGLILLVFILAFFSPTKWSIEAEVIIDKSKADIYNYIKLLRNSENYNKWVMLDPNMSREFKGTDGTVGFIYLWDSPIKQVGKGEQEVIAMKENEFVEYEIRFFKPFQGVSTSMLKLQEINSTQTKVSWSFNSSNTYMMKVLHVLLNLKKVLKKDLQTSLGNLKSLLEK